MGGIFISYRREDSRHPAGRLYDRLLQSYRKDLLFMDVDAIEPGADFHDVIGEKVASCDVMLVVIGPQWLGIRDEDGNRRLDRPNDFVRLEIEAALDINTRLIPVLVDGAAMPREDWLPQSLQPLARRNAVRLSYERFGNDARLLADSLRPYVTSTRKRWLTWGRNGGNATAQPVRAEPQSASIAAFVEVDPSRPDPVEAPRTDPRRSPSRIPPRPALATPQGPGADATRPRQPAPDLDAGEPGTQGAASQPFDRIHLAPMYEPEPLPDGHVMSADEATKAREHEALLYWQSAEDRGETYDAQAVVVGNAQARSRAIITLVALSMVLVVLGIGRTMDWFDPIAGVTRLFRPDAPPAPEPSPEGRKQWPEKTDPPAPPAKTKLLDPAPVQPPKQLQLPRDAPNGTSPEERPSVPDRTPPPQGPRTHAPNQTPPDVPPDRTPPPRTGLPADQRRPDTIPDNMRKDFGTPRDPRATEVKPEPPKADAGCRPARGVPQFSNREECHKYCRDNIPQQSAQIRNPDPLGCIIGCNALCER